MNAADTRASLPKVLKKFGRLYMIAFPLGLNVLALGYGLRFARVTQYPDSATVFFIEMVIIVITSVRLRHSSVSRLLTTPMSTGRPCSWRPTTLSFLASLRRWERM